MGKVTNTLQHRYQVIGPVQSFPSRFKACDFQQEVTRFLWGHFIYRYWLTQVEKREHQCWSLLGMDQGCWWTFSSDQDSTLSEELYGTKGQQSPISRNPNPKKNVPPPGRVGDLFVFHFAEGLFPVYEQGKEKWIPTSVPTEKKPNQIKVSIH